jgi:hypothetical protein
MAGRPHDTPSGKDRERPLAGEPDTGDVARRQDAGGNRRGKRNGVLQIDPATMEIRKVPVEGSYDLAVRDDGLAFVVAGQAGTDVTVDVHRGTCAGKQGGVAAVARSDAAGRRLYARRRASGRGTLPVPADVTRNRCRCVAGRTGSSCGDRVTPDGQFLLYKTGTVLRAASARRKSCRPRRSNPLSPRLWTRAGVALLLGGDGRYGSTAIPKK